MTVTYRRLWKLLIDRNLTKSDLRKMTGITANTFTRLNKGQDVSLSTLVTICETLNVDLEDVVEIIRDKGDKQ